jgi:hypothetical protein
MSLLCTKADEFNWANEEYNGALLSKSSGKHHFKIKIKCYPKVAVKIVLK